MKISAIIVSYNEGKLLDNCLLSLKGNDQLIVVDLGSSDNSMEIARRYTSQVISHGLEPIAEFILPDILDVLENDWFIRADPDEVFPSELLSDIVHSIENNPQAAIIELPFEYYFFGKPLTTTVWGGIRHFPKVMNKQRVTIHKRVHGAFEVKEPYRTVKIPYTGRNAVKHYWITSWKQLTEKHLRYLLLEGKSKFERGERFSWVALVKSMFLALAFNLIKYKGLQGGFTGISLSFFHAWYVGMSWLSLRKYQKNPIDIKLR